MTSRADEEFGARVELDISGMTCASCSVRIERSLNRLEGVVASVNFATEKAAVSYDPALVSAERLIETVEAAGYGADLPRPVTEEDGGAEADALRWRVGVAIALSVPVALLAMVPPLRFPGWDWVAAVLTTPVVAWCGLVFHRATLANARHRTVTMDTLITVGTVAAYVWSLQALVRGGSTYFEVSVVVTTAILLGRYFEARARGRAGTAIAALLELGAKDVAVLDADGIEQRVPVERLKAGDRFVVRPGEKVATDGVVLEGASAVDASMLTGESVPAEVGPRDEVAGATINTAGRLVVRATRVGADTALAQIARLVAEAQQGKAPVQRLADRISAVFVPIVIGLAVAAFAFWLGIGAGADRAFTAAVAVLIIACPCALGLATPTALLVGTGRGAQLGLIIRGPQILESTRRIDTVVLDKTGTITTGTMSLHETVTADGTSEEAALRLAGALERASEHPIARAISAAAGQHHLRAPVIEGFTNHAGLGVEGIIEGVRIVVGRRWLLIEEGMGIPAAIEQVCERMEAGG